MVLNGPASDQTAMLNFLSRTYLPNRLITILYLIPPSSSENGQFPVNKLRNLGIRNIVGTHFQILDMDLWPTVNLYDTLMSLPKSLIENDGEKTIEVSWGNSQGVGYITEIEVKAEDRMGILTDIMTIINEAKISLNGLNAKSTKGNLAFISIKVKIDSIEQLKDLMKKIRKLKGIIDVYRLRS